MNKPIPVNSIALSGNEKKYINECIDTGWISSEGPFVERFEKEFSQYAERSFGVAVCNGSAALDIAVIAAGIQPGDEVIMPAFTIISPALSVIKAGAKPVLVDSDPITWNMNVDQIEKKITSRTKAIIVVHIYGLPCDMHPILEIAKKHKLKIIEDAAEMHGQTYIGKKCGSFGDISIFSFYPNKLITTGEGGMILCDDENIASHCRKLRNLAFEPNGPRFIHHEVGFNYRMTNMQAAIGVAQLEQIELNIKKKRRIGNKYNERLAFLENFGYRLPKSKMDYAENIYWVYGIVAPDETEKNRLTNHLDKNNIGYRPFFWSLHEQPVLNKKRLFLNEIYPVSERLSRNGIYIPSGVGITEQEIERVCETIKKMYD
ncbi:MAG TPA: DegT/DnrJ/EryC1/StrS family aminotransferase [Segetibacter sp.]|jgi:perosamine synthetase